MSRRGSTVREENVDVMLSNILNEYGLRSVSLPSIRGDFPDVYLVVRGLRVVVELKELGHRRQLELQLEDRVRENMCEIAVGVEYPLAVVSGTPSEQEVQRRLREAGLTVFAYAVGSAGPILVFPDEQVVTSELPDLLVRLTSRAIPEREIDEAVENVRNALQDFTRELAATPNVGNTATRIQQALNLGD